MTKIHHKHSGYYGEFGGQYVPEILMEPLRQLETAFYDAIDDDVFMAKFNDLLTNYAGRPTPLTLCRNISPNPRVKNLSKKGRFATRRCA